MGVKFTKWFMEYRYAHNKYIALYTFLSKCLDVVVDSVLLLISSPLLLRDPELSHTFS